MNARLEGRPLHIARWGFRRIENPVKKRAILVGGVTFTAKGPGRYFSKCGRYGIFHMFADKADHQWELHEVGKDGSIGDLIDYALTMGEIVHHAKQGQFSERSNFKLDGKNS